MALQADMQRYQWTMVSIPFSHFNERARWALDLAAVTYRTVRVLPLFNMPVVAIFHRWYGHVGRRDRVSSPLSTPLLVGRPPSSASATSSSPSSSSSSSSLLHAAPARLRPVVVDDSGAIVELVDRERKLRLYPAEHADAIRELEKRLHDDLGPPGRVLDYNYLLPSWTLTARIMFHNAGLVQATLFMLLFPLIRMALRKGLGVSEARAVKATDKIRAVFADMSRLLEANAVLYKTDRPYLIGNTFTAADLTFAALASIVVNVNHEDGFGAWMPRLVELPPGLRAISEGFRATPAGQHALRMYREHRRPAI